MTDQGLHDAQQAAAFELACDLDAALSAMASAALRRSLGEIPFLRIPADPTHARSGRTTTGPAAAGAARAHTATSAAERIARARGRRGAAPASPPARP